LIGKPGDETEQPDHADVYSLHRMKTDNLDPFHYDRLRLDRYTALHPSTRRQKVRKISGVSQRLTLRAVNRLARLVYYRTLRTPDLSSAPLPNARRRPCSPLWLWNRTTTCPHAAVPTTHPGPPTHHPPSAASLSSPKPLWREVGVEHLGELLERPAAGLDAEDVPQDRVEEVEGDEDEVVPDRGSVCVQWDIALGMG
jgi:hypothetical protein